MTAPVETVEIRGASGLDGLTVAVKSITPLPGLRIVAAAQPTWYPNVTNLLACLLGAYITLGPGFPTRRISRHRP